MLASLPYDALRAAASPDEALLAFLQRRYDAAAACGNWNRKALECLPDRVGFPTRPITGSPHDLFKIVSLERFHVSRKRENAPSFCF